MPPVSTLVAHRPLLFLSGLFGICVVVFLVTIPLPRADHLLIGSDGVLYYEYTRSLVLDGDLDFADEQQHFSRYPGVGPAPAPTVTGRLPNRMPIGTGLVWIPFFVVAHGLDALFGSPHDGYGTLEQAAVCLGSMAYGFAGLLLTYRLCREHADGLSSGLAVMLIWFGTNVIYYMVAEPSMSHMASLGAVSALLAWWRLHQPQTSAWHWLGMGALGGLAALLRPQDGLFLILPAMQWGHEGWDLLRRRHGGVLAHFGRGVLMGGAAVLAYAPQLWAWHILYGSIAHSGYADTHRFNWLHPRLVDVLFSLRHGFFTWHPMYLVGGFGLWWLARHDRVYTVRLVLAVAVQVYVIAAWDMWWQGDAFGGRMLIATAPIFALGVAQVIVRLRRRGWLLVTAAAALLLWNLAFFIQYRFGFIPMGQPITWEQLVADKLVLPWELWRRWRR